MFFAPCMVVDQGSATCGTRDTLGTPSNFLWHAEAQRFTYECCYDSQEVLLTLDCSKIWM